MATKHKVGAIALFAVALFVYFAIYGNNIDGNITSIKFLFFGEHPGSGGCSVAAGDCPPGFVEGIRQGLLIDVISLSIVGSMAYSGINLWLKKNKG